MKIPQMFVAFLATCLLAGDILGEQKVTMKRETKRSTRLSRQLNREEMLQNIIKWLQEVYSDQQKSRRSRSFSEEFETPFTPYSLFASNRKDDAFERRNLITASSTKRPRPFRSKNSLNSEVLEGSFSEYYPSSNSIRPRPFLKRARQNDLRQYLPPSYTERPRPFEPRPSGSGTDEEGNFVDGGYPPAGITPQPPFPIYTNPITGGITGVGYPSPTGPVEDPSSSVPESYPTPGPITTSTSPSYSTQSPSSLPTQPPTSYPSPFPTEAQTGYPTEKPAYPPFPPVTTERQDGSTGYPVQTEKPLGPTEGPHATGYPTGRPEATSELPGFPTGYPDQSPHDLVTPGYPGFPTAPPPGYTTGYPTSPPPEATSGYPTAATPGFPTAPPSEATPQTVTPGYSTAPPQTGTPGYSTAPPQTVTPGFPTRPPTGYPTTSGELSTSGPASTQQPEEGTSGNPVEPSEQPSEGSTEGTPTDEDLKHPPHIHAIDVACAKDMMTINIEFNREFNGLIYSKGFYHMQECRYVKENSGQTKYTFTVNLNICGTEFINAFDTQGQSYLENVLVIQNELGIQEVWDTVRSVRCLWEGSLTDHLSVGLMVGMLTQEIVTFSGDTAMARLDILVGRGPDGQPATGLVKIGEPMTLVVSISGDPGFDVQVKDCRAVDSSGENAVPLTDEDGCVLKPKLFGAFQKSRKTGNSGASIIAYAYFNAFKFPDVMDIMMECNIELCKTDCEMCPKPGQSLEPARRRRRDLRPPNDTLADGVMMGKHLRVVLPQDLGEALAVGDGGVCMSTQSFVFSSSILVSLLTASCFFSAYVWLKGQRAQVYGK